MAALGLGLGLGLALLWSPGAILAQSTPVASSVLGAQSFQPITQPDLAAWDSSGCSFAVFRGDDLIGLFDVADPRRTALFRIDGTVIQAAASKPALKAAYWTGQVPGGEVRLVKGRRNPKFSNDGGSIGGEGKLEWSAPSGHGSIAVRWEEGC